MVDKFQWWPTDDLYPSCCILIPFWNNRKINRYLPLIEVVPLLIVKVLCNTLVQIMQCLWITIPNNPIHRYSPQMSTRGIPQWFALPCQVYTEHFKQKRQFLSKALFSEFYKKRWLIMCCLSRRWWGRFARLISKRWRPCGRQVVLLQTEAGNKTKFILHDDVIKCQYFARCWPFGWRIQRSPVHSPHKGQWRGALMFSLICAWING